ncbi:MAG: hypothetical protein JXQ29_12800 [Planctomycetes bacterium]|nr:hypothetical protein [Planctomycetota bacterium]
MSASVALLAWGVDWLQHLDQLLPIIVVVAIGLLTLVKRGVEILLKRRAERARTQPPDSAAGRAAPEPLPTVFEEMRRYFEMIEGRPATTTEGAPPAAPPAPPRRRPARIPLPMPSSPAEATRFLETAHAPAPGALPLSAQEELRSLPASRRTQALRRLRPIRGLPRVRLGNDRMSLRAAFLWREILGRPRGA